MLKLSGMLVALSLVSQMAMAKVLVISDIDDTLKVSHILSKAGSISSVVDSSSRFAGMTELFRGLAASHEDIEFHYVSLAPDFLMEERHKSFLENNQFPVTQLHLNPGVKQDPQLKQKVIRKLLMERNPDLVIYFGDNGQFDTLVYDQMAKEFPKIPRVTYIREAYSAEGKSKYPTRPGEIGFVTTVEVAIDLIQKRILPAKVYPHIENEVYTKLVKEDEDGDRLGKMVFPHWQDCRDFVWRWPVAKPSAKLLAIHGAIERKCAQ